MAGNNDFFLDFGSNAGTWAKQLAKDLAPARLAVGLMMQDLEKLNRAGASAVAGRRLGPFGQQLPPPGGTPPTQSSSSALSSNPSDIAAGVSDMVRNLASYDAEMAHLMSRLGTMVGRMDQLSILSEKDRKGFLENTRRQNISNAQRRRQSDPETASLRDPKTGQTVTAGTSGAVSFAPGEGNTSRRSSGTTSTVSIAGTPRVLVDEAAFARVVQAVERNIDATRAVENAINRLNSRGGVPGGHPQGEGESETGAGAPETGREARLAQLQAEFKALQAEREQLAGQDEKITQAERRVANREKSAAEKAARLPAQDRANRQRDIDLAGGDTETLRKLPIRDLRRISETFTEEGYKTPFNTKTTKPQFVERIQASRQEYERSGEVTKNDLRVSDKVLPTEVSKSVRGLVSEIVKAAKFIEGEAEAFKLRALDRRSGGQDTRLRGDDGKERVQRGLVQRGAAFGDRKANEFDSPEVQAAAGGRKLNEVIAKAEQTIAARNERISEAAIQQGLKFTQRPGFNPYSPEYRAGIQGKGDEAISARSGLSKLVSATQAIDKVGSEVIELDRRLNQAQTALSKMSQAADIFANKEKLSADEVARYTALLAKLPQQEARVEAQRARLGDIQGHEAFLTPEFRQGLAARQSSQTAYNDARQENAAKRALEKQTNPVQAAMEALFGSATNIGSASGNKATFSRLFPGVTPRGRGSTRGLGFVDADRDPRELEPLTSAFNKYGSAVREREAIAATGDGENAKKAIAEIDQKIAKHFEKIINAYERVMGTKLPTDVENGLRTYSRAQQHLALNPRTDFDTALSEGRANARAGGGASGGGGGRGGRTAAGAADSSGGGRRDNDRIVQVLNAIHATIKAGIKLTPTRPGQRRPRAGTPDTAAAEGAANAAPRPRRDPPLYSTKAGRGAFIQNLAPEMQALVQGENKVDAAVALVNKRILSQTEALGFFRSELKQTAKQASDFEKNVRAGLGDARLGAKGDAEARRRQREAALAAAGDPKAEAAARQQLRTQSLLADTFGRLSPEAKKYVAELKEMIRTGASAVQIADQQVKVYGKLAAELGSANFKTPQIRARAAGVFADAGSKVSGSELQGIAKISQATAPALGKQGEAMGKSLRGGVANLFGDHGFWSRVVASTGTFIVRNFSAGFVFGITNVLQEAVSQAIETESTFVRVSAALESTGRSTSGLRSQLQSISTDYGVELKDVYETTASLVGLFNTPKELAGATRIVAQLSSISRGALNAAEATASLASITSSFGDLRSVEGLQHIADVLTVIQERVGVNIETTAEGIARMSGLAQQVGLTFEQTAVLVGEIAKKTGQTGAAAGEQFSRIVATLQTGRGRESLIQNLPKDSGITAALNNREYGQAIEILMKNYQGLTKAQQDNIAISLGGQRQAAAINALLSEGSKTLDTITAAQDAKNQADTRSAQIANTLSGQLNKLKSNVVNLIQELTRTGIIDFFGVLLQLLNKVLGTTNSLLSHFNDFADDNPLIGFLKTATFGVAGLALAVILLRKALSGLRATFSGGGSEGLANLATGGLAGAGGGRDPGAPDERRRLREERETAARERRAARGGGLTGALGGFYEGGALRAQARQTSLQDFAERQRARLAEREPGFIGPQRPGAGRIGLSTGVGTAVGSIGQSSVALRASAAAATGASRGLGLVSGGLTRLSGIAGPATAALVGLGVGIAFIIDDLRRRAAFAKRQQSAFDARYGADQGKTQDEIDKAGYVGPSSELNKSRLEQQSGLGGKLGVLGGGLAGAIEKGPRSKLEWLLPPVALADIAHGVNKQIGQDLGEIPDSVQKQLDAVRKDSFKELVSGKGGTASAPGGEKAADILLSKEQQTSKLLAAQQTSADTLKKAAEQIQNNAKLSREQKAAALAQLEEIRKAQEDVTQSLLLQIQGLGDANALTLEQVQKVDQFVQTTSNLSQSTANDYAVALDQMVKDVGLSEGANIAPQLDKLKRGGLTQVDQLKAQLSATKDEASALSAEYLAYANGKGDEQQIEDAKAAAAAKIAQIDQISQALIAAEVQSGTEFATFLRGRGDYAGASTQLDGAIAALRAEANKPGQAQDKKIALLNQAEQIAEQQTEDRISQATRGEQLAKSQTQNAVSGAQLELTIAKKTLAERKKAFASGGGTQAQVDAAQQQYNQALHGYADTIQAQTQSGYSVQAAQTLNSVAKAQIEQKAALQALTYAQSTFGVGSSQYNAALAQYAQSGQAFGQALQDQAQSLYQLQAARTNDPVAKAGIEIRAAKTNVEFALKTYKAGSVQYNNALAGLWQSRMSYAQSEEDQRQSGFAVQAARTLNAVAKANVEAAAADDAYQAALAQGNKAAANNALAQKISAQQAARAAREEQNAAARETGVTKLAPGDAVGIAFARVSNARAAQRDAAKFGRASVQYQQATQAVIEAVRAANDAVLDVLRANSGLAIALAEAAGKTVEAARLRLQEARAEVARARQKSGGKRTADVINAEAGAVAAEAGYRDAALQDKLDTIDFNQQMGRITSQGAIAALQAILKATNLTQQQRRELQLKIKGLQDDLRSNLTGSGFNIPDQIKLPTPYEVRRSLGVDKYLKTVQATINKSVATPGTRTASELGSSLSPAAVAPSVSTPTSSTAVVNALDSVRQAVVANGAQVVNDIAITNQVSSPAMVEAVARRVVELINTSTIAGARANQAAPKLVSY